MQKYLAQTWGLSGKVIDTHREWTEEEIARIAAAYHAWRGEPGTGEYVDVPGFCKSATLVEIQSHGYVLMPGCCVGAKEVEDDDEPFQEKMQRLTAKLGEQFAVRVASPEEISARLEAAIREDCRRLG